MDLLTEKSRKSSLGGMAGKMIDDFYKVGRAQTALGIVNDIATMYTTGTTWSGSAINPRSITLIGLSSDIYTTGYYYNETTKK